MSIKFNRYASLHNTYDRKNLTWWLSWNQGLRDATYVVTEKLHGANFSIWIDADGSVRHAKRSGFIHWGRDKFYRYQEALEEPALAAYVEQLACQGRAIALFGELFGGGVQTEVDYGPQQRIRFFDVFDSVHGEYLAPVVVHAMIPAELRVPHIGLFSGIDAALAVSDEFPTLINPRPGNTCEGVVIRPWNMTYRSPVGERFILKKKNERFTERATPRQGKSNRTGPHVQDETPKEVIAAIDLILPYVTEQRLSNVVSHDGTELSLANFAGLLRSFKKDVQEECLRENPHLEDGLDKGGRTILWKAVGTHCASVLHAAIKKGG